MDSTENRKGVLADVWIPGKFSYPKCLFLTEPEINSTEAGYHVKPMAFRFMEEMREEQG